VTVTSGIRDPTVWQVYPANSAPSIVPQSLTYRRKLLWVIAFAVLGFGSLMTLVTAALPTIAEDLDTTVTNAGWILTGLMLAMAIATPAGGKLGDIYGHRRIFLIGVIGMTITMVATYWVWSIGAFIFIRVLFGLSGALMMPTGIALLMHAFGSAERAKAVGWFQFAMTGAPTIGVVAGGPLLNLFGWRAVFLVFGAISTAAALAALLVVKPIPKGLRAKIDWLGTFLLAIATLLVLLAITRVPVLLGNDRQVASDPTLLAMLVGSFLLFWVFVHWEKRIASPLLDMRLFQKRSFSLPLLSAACNQFAYMGAFIVIPGVLQGPYGYSVGAAAMLMVPRPGIFALASPMGGYLVTRVGAQKPMYFGTTAMIGSMVAFALGSEPGGVGLAILMIGLMLSGVSAGIGTPAYQTLVANSVEDQDLGIANGMNQTVMFIGMILGIQSMLAIAGSDPSTERLRATFIFGASIAALGYIAPIFTGRRRS